MKKAFLLLKILISVCLLLFVFKSLGGFQAVLNLLKNANLLFIVFAFLLIVIGICISAIKWALIIKDLSGISIPYTRAIRYYWIGKFYSTVLPVSAGGDVMRHYFLRNEGVRTSTSVASILIDRGTGALAIFLIAGILLAASGFVQVGLLLFLGSLAALLIFFFKQSFFFSFFPDRFRPSSPDNPRSELALNRAGYNVLAVIFQLLVSIFVYLMMLGGNIVPSLKQVALMQTAELASMIPVSFQGLGLRELIYTKFIATNGVLATKFVAIGVLIFLLNLIASLPGFFFHLFEREAK